MDPPQETWGITVSLCLRRAVVESSRKTRAERRPCGHTPMPSIFRRSLRLRMPGSMEKKPHEQSNSSYTHSRPESGCYKKHTEPRRPSYAPPENSPLGMPALSRGNGFPPTTEATGATENTPAKSQMRPRKSKPPRPAPPSHPPLLPRDR